LQDKALPSGGARKGGLPGKVFAVYQKDLRLELRSKYAVNAIFLFGVTTLTLVSYSLGQRGLSPDILSALFWVILFFASMAGLAQVFIREEEAGTSLALRLTADPTAIYIGKLLFNLTLMSLLTLVIAPLFFVFMGAPTENLPLFFLVAVLGVIGLCAATTLVAAIISRTAVKGALFAVLSFPIMVLLLMLLVGATTKVLDNRPLGDITSELQGLVAYAVVMITASLMLFRFVWQD
jgi:heme exporter protein B